MDDSPGDAPLTGRHRELTTLGHQLDLARRGHKRVLFLEGEPGIGKPGFCRRSLHWADPATFDLLAGRNVSAAAYLLAMDDLRAFSRTVVRFFTSVDVWLTPTLSEPPVPLGELTSSADDPWRPDRRMQDFLGFPAIVANVNGAPAMSVPLYWNAAGLP